MSEENLVSWKTWKTGISNTINDNLLEITEVNSQESETKLLNFNKRNTAIKNSNTKIKKFSAKHTDALSRDNEIKDTLPKRDKGIDSQSDDITKNENSNLQRSNTISFRTNCNKKNLNNKSEQIQTLNRSSTSLDTKDYGNSLINKFSKSQAYCSKTPAKEELKNLNDNNECLKKNNTQLICNKNFTDIEIKTSGNYFFNLHNIFLLCNFFRLVLNLKK